MLVSDEIHNCPLCGEAIARAVADARAVYHVSCKVCAEYSITEEAVDLVRQRSQQDKRVLSGRACENVERGLPPVFVSTGNIDELIGDARVPRTPLEKLDRLLLSFYRRGGTAGARVYCDTKRDLAWAYAVSEEEFKFLFLNLHGQGFIEPGRNPAGGSVLTIKGWERVRELEELGPRSDQCFVAMWFDPSLDEAFNNGMRKAIEESGYRAMRVDLKEHNQKICDVIVAEIRRSGLMVADFTGHRGGVYFEAGFATGFGIPCIFTCRDDQIAEAHFDTRQYNHIVWTDAQDLYTQLLRRILATAPVQRTRGR